MDYWGEHPPAHIILAAVHMKPGARNRKKPANMREELSSEAAKFGLGENAGSLPEIYRSKQAMPKNAPPGPKGESDGEA